MSDDITNEILSFGIDASTCRPILPPQPADMLALLQAGEQGLAAAVGAPVPTEEHFGVAFGNEASNLDEVGWGLIFAAGVDPAPRLEALDALLRLRNKEAGTRYRVFSGGDGWRPGESASQWLVRHGSSLDLIDPEDGVPYYLVVVGSPAEVSFEFQYSLDLSAAVGRIDFPTLEEYEAYADSVVAFETNAAKQTARTIDLFAPCHDFDRATQLFTSQVAQPFCTGVGTRPPLGQKLGFRINPVLAGDATKSGLAAILRRQGRPSSILLTGSHGMAFEANDARLPSCQGALVCQDWSGYDSIDERHWFSSKDVPEDANVHGLIHFYFACYGAGSPEFDNFSMPPGSKRSAPAPMTAKLPQRLMTLPQGGVLATLGHIDKAWASSFQNSKGVSQTQQFREILEKLLSGLRVGDAVDRFNLQWGVSGTQLTDLLTDKVYGKAVRDSEMLAARIKRDDCRNYVVLGDPAVRLRPMPA
jgi:hypothetical protein